MRLLFRLEAGREAGWGHASRCLSLVKVLSVKYQGHIRLLTRNAAESIFDNWRKAGAEVVSFSGDDNENLVRSVTDQNPDALIIDHLFPYSTEAIRSAAKICPVVMIHGLGEGRFEASAVIYPNAHMDEKVLADERWRSGRVKMFSGWPYVILGEKVLEFRGEVNPIWPLRKIAVVAGGSDPGGMLRTILPMLGQLDFDCTFSGFYGEAQPGIEELRSQVAPYEPQILLKKFDWSEIAACDAAFCAFGVSAYELLYLGMPLITVGHAVSNDEAGDRLAKRYGFTSHLGLLANLDRASLEAGLRKWVSLDTGEISTRATAARSQLDGKGAERCADIIAKLVIA
jgi:UDP-2,4-diacetamido-2,4,6-trideoxy-beta-L-altropyranose hydrolase